jgi:hypothetical protein
LIYVRVNASPVRYYYTDARTLPSLPTGSARHALLVSVGDIRSEAGGENANMSVTLRNGECEASALLSVPPIGATADIIDTVRGTLFSGVVQSVSLGDVVASLEIEA